MSGSVVLDRRGKVQLIRLARPDKKNAIDGPMYGRLGAAPGEGGGAPDVAPQVLLGSPGIFTAGNDIAAFLAAAQTGVALADDVLAFVRLLPRLTKPLIAGVDGVAVGIGTTLLLHCDLVYASPQASFSTPFLALGLVPEAASSLLMPLRMGHARAFEMLALGTTFPAERMVQAGVVNGIVPSADLEVVVTRAAEALAA